MNFGKAEHSSETLLFTFLFLEATLFPFMKMAMFYVEERPTIHLLRKAAKKAGFDARMCHLDDVRVFIDNADVRFFVKGVELSEFDVVFVREVRDYYREFRLLLQYCGARKIPMFDTGLMEIKGSSKIDGMMRYAINGLPVPKTVFANHKDEIGKILKNLSFPMVAKENRSRQGKQVFLLKNKKELGRFLHCKNALRTMDTPTYLFQEFIPSDCDIRVLVLGYKVLGAIERRAGRPGEFRCNVALGGIAKLASITPEMRRLAVSSARLEKFEFAGIDLIKHKETGKYYILEVNRSPEFEGFMEATGIDVPYEAMKYYYRKLKR